MCGHLVLVYSLFSDYKRPEILIMYIVRIKYIPEATTASPLQVFFEYDS